MAEYPLCKGDKVRVVGLEDSDIEKTNLKIGSTGVVARGAPYTYDEYAVVIVDFGDNFECESSSMNLVDEGYFMYAKQLEKIEEG